jgi:type I restriction enzyme, R subunit
VLDFVAIFDKLKKALTFDSEEVAAVVKEIGVLKALVAEKIEATAPEYLALVSGRFDDKDVDALIEHFRDPARRKELSKVYKQLEMLYEIISPDAFLRPYMETYSSLSAIYAVVRNA